MRTSRKLAARAFALAVAAALGFGAVQASAAPPAGSKAAFACPYSHWKACRDSCLARYGEGTQSQCVMEGSFPQCYCYP
jgi:hypothetical protein